MSTPSPVESAFATTAAPEVEPAEFGTNVGELIDERVTTISEPSVYRDLRRCNLGKTERNVRLGTGAALLGAAAFAPVNRGWRIGFAVLGAAQLITGARQYCPLWHALGIDTRRPGE